MLTQAKIPFGLTVTPDGEKVYILNSSGSDVSVFNTATNTITAAIPVGLYPYSAACTPDGSRIYVTNLLSNLISVIDTASDTVVNTITSEIYPAGIALRI
ncbi:YncE family protein [Bacillus atrophaeus]|jgi:YVTN family beta-propeller protein|uniref:YncE family protein n=1 Tax=Bacillus atrophaeus TaxID=1452 RepID=UPI002DB9C3E7|nr:YncE family protein [Bacillus atrophaeus]